MTISRVFPGLRVARVQSNLAARRSQRCVREFCRCFPVVENRVKKNVERRSRSEE
jgi:hypothetical protein